MRSYLEKSLWPTVGAVALFIALGVMLAIGAIHENNSRNALARRNCQEIEQVKATLVAFIAEITFYDAKTGRVQTPANRPKPSAAQMQETVEFNKLAERRFAVKQC